MITTSNQPNGTIKAACHARASRQNSWRANKAENHSNMGHPGGAEGGDEPSDAEWAWVGCPTLHVPHRTSKLRWIADRARRAVELALCACVNYADTSTA